MLTGAQGLDVATGWGQVLRSSRTLVISGFTFVGLFCVSVLLLGELLGQFGDPDQTFVDYYSDEANRWRDIPGGALLTLAALSLLVFFHGLTRQLRALGGAEAALELALLSGALGVGLLMTGAALLSVVAAAQAFGGLFGDEALTNASIALPPQIAYLLLLGPMMWALVLAIGLLAWSARKAGVWPRWLFGLSLAAVILLPLGAFAVMPVVLLPLWAASVSVWAWRR